MGRLGGDEFVVLLENLTLDAGAELVAERICEVLGQPIELDDADGTDVLDHDECWDRARAAGLGRRAVARR